MGNTCSSSSGNNAVVIGKRDINEVEPSHSPSVDPASPEPISPTTSNIVVTGKRDTIEIELSQSPTTSGAKLVPASSNSPNAVLGPEPIPSASVSSRMRTSRSSFRGSGVNTSSSILVVQKPLHSVPSSSGNGYTNGTQQVNNISSNYKWDADVFVASTHDQLLQKVKWCMNHGVSLRVKASGWSCNRFLDPSKSADHNDQEVGVQIILAGEFDGVMKVDDPEGTITAGAATQREPIYSILDKSGRQLMCSGECFTATESQAVGGLIANAVHDTMQESFSPETVLSLEALVFDENKDPVIRSFSSADGDDYFAFFGGMGMTGIIVSATLKCIDKKYYHYRPYLPGSKYDDDDSFEVGKEARDLSQLICRHNIKNQGEINVTGRDLDVNVPRNGGLSTYRSSFANALKDLCDKHRCDKDDICAMFYLFPLPEDEEKASRELGRLADGSVTAEGLGRYWKRSYEQKPQYTVTQDIYNDISPLMGKEYLQDPKTIDALFPSLLDVQNSVTSTKWKYANLMNHTTKESKSDDVKLALSDKCRHWAVCESEVAHTTGPSYIYCWERATEFYVKEKDIDAFVQILQPAVVAMIGAAIKEGTTSSNAASIFADCRYALKSEDAFMTGWYKEDHLAVDIGCTKHHFTNSQYETMTKRVLTGCKEQNIDIRLHTGKFYVYEEEFTHHMYSKEVRGQFGAVVSKFDPYGVFAPHRWRTLFTDNCSSILPPPSYTIEGNDKENSTKKGQLPSIPSPLALPFYYSSLSNFGVYYSVPLERVQSYFCHSGLVPATIDGMALVSFNFQLYSGHFNASPGDGPDKWPGTGASITQEVELCIVSVPEGKIDEVPEVSFEQFVLGDEQTKIMGNKRVHVPCDSDIAISAGVQLFGEPKFKTTFQVNLASRNPTRRPDTTSYHPVWSSTWGFQINDPDDPSKAICTCTSDLSGITSVPANFSPITEYGYHEKKLIGCRWNILQPMDTYFLPSDSTCVHLSFGQSNHPMKKDMQTLIGEMPPRAIRTFNSPPAAVQSRAFYP
jgi:hypothetical protein